MLPSLLGTLQADDGKEDATPQRESENGDDGQHGNGENRIDNQCGQKGEKVTCGHGSPCGVSNLDV